MSAPTGTARAALLLAAVLVFTGCTGTQPPPAGTSAGSGLAAHRHSTQRTHPPTATPTASPTSTTAPGQLIVAQGHGWTAAGLLGPTYPAGSCHSPRAASGQVLPDPRCTPGVIDGAVTQANLASTICATGYTTKIRPPLSLTGPAKAESAKEYGTTPAAGEYDHLISLELGGASDTRNLWVEADGPIPNPKDAVESALRLLVCKKIGVPGRYGEHPCPTCAALPLADAQMLIAGDWTTAIQKARPLMR